MKKIKKIITLLLLLVISIPLSSCDLSLFLKDSSKINNEENNTNNEDNTKTEENNNNNEDNTQIEISYDLNNYLSDYQNNYGYKALGNDLEHGELMQQAYKDYYEASKALLLSNTDYPVSVSENNGEKINFLNIYETDEISDKTLLDYYISAWSVFVSDNPIFYFLSNSHLSRTKVTTKTTTQNGEIIKTEEVTTYSFILVGYEEFVTFNQRDEINKKIVDLFNDTKEFSELNDYNKALKINEYLINKLEYAYKSDGTTPEDSYWAHNIIGLLTKNKGVCECYAKSYRLLSNHYGLNSISVYGKTKSNESHAWNYTCLNDIWYGVDVTWNDSVKNNKYFLCENAVMAEDHIPYMPSYGIDYQPALPVLSETAYISE